MGSFSDDDSVPKTRETRNVCMVAPTVSYKSSKAKIDLINLNKLLGEMMEKLQNIFKTSPPE